MSNILEPTYTNSDVTALSEKFLALLCKNKKITDSEAKEYMKVAEKSEATVDVLLTRAGKLSQIEALTYFAQATGLEAPKTIDAKQIDHSTIEELGLDYVRRSLALPILNEGDKLVIATCFPANFKTLKIIEFSQSRPIHPVLTTQENLLALIEQAFPAFPNENEVDTSDQGELLQLANQGPVVSYINALFDQAIERKASDIHFESGSSGLQTRFRIGGSLVNIQGNQDIAKDAVISRLKFLANLNLSERRKPLDGRISFKHAGRNIDMRLSILPTQFGQSAVIRVLDQGAIELDWHALGFGDAIIASIRELISRPNGLFLVTGPTGSGKTTTLYTALSELNKPDCKILTVEDPIEYNLAGINQIQVNDAVGLNFASALRSILRQDPNIILIGEIRDAETAEMACRAALVGRLVLSTLHVNSPDLAKTRLLDLGVAEYLVDAVLIGVLGQELRVQKQLNNDEVSNGGTNRLSSKLIKI